MTPEEVKATVLKECERTIPRFQDTHLINEGLGMRRITEQGVVFEWQHHQESSHPTSVAFSIYPEIACEEPIWDTAHRLLNLEARELEARLNMCDHWLRKIANEPSIAGENDHLYNPLVEKMQGYAETALNQWKGGGA
jgi:hypothetical protein